MAHVYSHLKFFGYPKHIAAVHARQVLPPVHVRIKPINHCNHSCWYCAYRADQLQLGGDMDVRDRIPDAKMFEIASDLISMGVQAVTFSGGGEPLIYKRLPEVIEILAAGGIRVAALTNGSNLKGIMANAFAEHGTWIRVSLDAWDDASYAKSRGVKMGEYSSVLANMREFAKRDTKCFLGVSFIINKNNVDHIADVCRQLKDIGVHHVKLSAAVVSNDVRHNNLYHRAIMDHATAEINNALSLRDSGFSVLNHYHETEERFEKSYEICPYLQFQTVIGADCNIYTCQDKAYNPSAKLGSIRDKSFNEFWFSDENRRRLFAVNPTKDCQHHCVTHAKNTAIMDFLAIDSEHARFV